MYSILWAFFIHSILTAFILHSMFYAFNIRSRLLTFILHSTLSVFTICSILPAFLSSITLTISQYFFYPSISLGLLFFFFFLSQFTFSVHFFLHLKKKKAHYEKTAISTNLGLYWRTVLSKTNKNSDSKEAFWIALDLSKNQIMLLLALVQRSPANEREGKNTMYFFRHLY